MDKRIDAIFRQFGGVFSRFRPMMILAGLLGAGVILAAIIMLVVNPYELDYDFEARRILSSMKVINPWEVPFDRFSEQDFRAYSSAMRSGEKGECQKISSKRLKKTCIAYFVQQNVTVSESLVSK